MRCASSFPAAVSCAVAHCRLGMPSSTDSQTINTPPSNVARVGAAKEPPVVMTSFFRFPVESRWCRTKSTLRTSSFLAPSLDRKALQSPPASAAVAVTSLANGRAEPIQRGSADFGLSAELGLRATPGACDSPHALVRNPTRQANKSTAELPEDGGGVIWGTFKFRVCISRPEIAPNTHYTLRKRLA